MLGRCRGTLANVACVAGGGGGWRPLLNRPLACILCPSHTHRMRRALCEEGLAQCRQLRRSELPPSRRLCPRRAAAPPAHPSSHGRAMLFGIREATIRATEPSAAFTRNTRYLLSGKPCPFVTDQAKSGEESDGAMSRPTPPATSAAPLTAPRREDGAELLTSMPIAMITCAAASSGFKKTQRERLHLRTPSRSP